MLLNGDAVRSSWNMWLRGCTFKDLLPLWFESPNLLPGSLQDCASRQELQGSLKQVQKLLSAHETSYLQSLRNLKKKINLMQSSATKQPARATNSKEKPGSSAVSHLFQSTTQSVLRFFTGTCTKLEAPTNGRKLGKSQSVGHEVHFLCHPGYELVGSETRVCQESLTWSGQQTSCRGECPSSVASFKVHFVCVVQRAWWMTSSLLWAPLRRRWQLNWISFQLCSCRSHTEVLP